MFFIKILEEKKHENEHCNNKKYTENTKSEDFFAVYRRFYPIKYDMNTLKKTKYQLGKAGGELTSWPEILGA